MIQHLAKLNNIVNKYWLEWIMSHAKERYCFWSRQDADILWYTSCDKVFLFTVEGPSEHKFVYCPFCGKELFEKKEKKRN